MAIAATTLAFVVTCRLLRQGLPYERWDD